MTAKRRGANAWGGKSEEIGEEAPEKITKNRKNRYLVRYLLAAGLVVVLFIAAPVMAHETNEREPIDALGELLVPEFTAAQRQRSAQRATYDALIKSCVPPDLALAATLNPNNPAISILVNQAILRGCH